ncbi:hypothetical protein D9758_009604 [Tetrapyrgos nigripes]|uniref:MYND-type domain-containing protein n=1 Tax=Tetrapyrgos nigripes TaxID=182062 RepID=A0A8H5GDA9_9AGAR|nr:hypothetical protein D9758_009604 [Tetrapyrgos nigripes]
MSAPEDNPQYSGGIRLSEEIKTLCSKPGFLKTWDGGQRLRILYQEESLNWDLNQLSPFGRACYMGMVDAVVRTFIMSNGRINLKGHESGFNTGYLSLIALGVQRVTPIPGGPPIRHLETFKFLLSRGASVDSQDIVGYTALHHLCQMGVSNKDLCLQLLRLLLQHGANVNHQNRYGEVAIYLCLLSNNVQALDVLLENGADTSIPEADGLTPEGNYLRYGPQVTAVMAKWVRKRGGEEELPRQGKKSCFQCGKDEVALKNCSRCQVARYCSTECQKMHWPTHKQQCQPFSTSNTVVLKPSYNNLGHLVPISDHTRKVLGFPESSEIPKRKTRGAAVPKTSAKESKNLIIKVQVPFVFTPNGGNGGKPAPGNGDLAVYTKKRDFVCVIKRTEQTEGGPGVAYDRIANVVKTKGVGGAKAYFAAELKSKDELVVKISEVLAEQPF